MQNTSHDQRELHEAIDNWVKLHPVEPDALEHLRRKLGSLLDWVKLFRRSLATSRRHDTTHPTYRAAIDELLNRTRTHLRAYGALTLRIGPGETMSDEGIVLPQVLDDAHEGHTFFCLFRDGIAAFHLKPGIEPAELSALLEVVGANERREGDDAVTWLWSGRHRHIRIEVESSIGPRLAAMLHSRNPNDPGVAGYVAALHAAVASSAPPTTTPVGREHAASLGAYRIDPQNVERLLTAGADASEFPRLNDQASDILAQWFESPQERSRRTQIIATIAAGGGGTP